jgi:hypothetical protein
MMISETEMKIGTCERLFDIARDKLEKAIVALEEADERGKAVAKLAAEVADEKSLFASAIENLNQAYARRDSKTPLVVPPLDHYLELFRKNAAAKREAQDSARRDEVSERIQRATIPENHVVQIREAELAIARGHRVEPEPPARSTSPQDLVDELEVKINRLKSEIDYADEQLRPVRVAQASSRLAELQAAKSPRLQFAQEQLIAKKAELAQLTVQHEALLAEVRQKPLAQSSATR